MQSNRIRGHFEDKSYIERSFPPPVSYYSGFSGLCYLSSFIQHTPIDFWHLCERLPTHRELTRPHSLITVFTGSLVLLSAQAASLGSFSCALQPRQSSQCHYALARGILSSSRPSYPDISRVLELFLHKTCNVS